jgi:hypothetical protein
METITERLVFPPKVAAGINLVCQNIETIAKNNRNNFGNYNYVSVDDMFAMVGPLEAAAGIIILANERSTSVINKTLEAIYEIYIIHTSGESAGPIIRSVQLSATGPQSYGSAESYVLKQFVRGLYKIPTNETEEEGFKKQDLPDKPKKELKQKPTEFDVETSAAKRVELIGSLAKLTSTAALVDWNNQTFDDRNRLIKQDYEAVKANYEKIQAELKGNKNG